MLQKLDRDKQIKRKYIIQKLHTIIYILIRKKQKQYNKMQNTKIHNTKYKIHNKNTKYTNTKLPKYKIQNTKIQNTKYQYDIQHTEYKNTHIQNYTNTQTL